MNLCSMFKNEDPKRKDRPGNYTVYVLAVFIIKVKVTFYYFNFNQQRQTKKYASYL